MNQLQTTISNEDDRFSKLDIVRIGLKVAKVIVKTAVRHPTMMFNSPSEVLGTIDAEKLSNRETRRESIRDKMFVDLAHYALTHEIGPEQHRLGLTEGLEEVRYEHGLPLTMPVQVMKEASKEF